MTDDEREAIRKEAKANADRYWQYNTNPFHPSDTRRLVYDDDYKDAGGKN